MRQLLTNLITALLTSATLALPVPMGEDVIHEVAENDTIFTISRQYGLAPDHVLWANDLSMRRLPKTGQKLVIPLRRIPPFTPPESTAIVLNLPERMLYLFRGHQLIKFWGVAVGGAQYPTPTGDFRILDKEKNPVWEPPAWLEKPAVAAGPDNPLGDRWMQITPDMIGIHGTNNPDSIGGVASLGCVRLYPEAIRELYDQVSVGTPVYVTYEQARVGQEKDGTLIWSFFPDPYAKYYSVGQARAGLNEASTEGHSLEISDFEIRERSKSPSGLITPVFGIPIPIESDLQLDRISALKKPTGDWLDCSVLSKMGYEIETISGKTFVRSPEGKEVQVSHSDLPLNPRQLPILGYGEELKLEGHRWNRTTWLPIPLILEYFEIPHEWDKGQSKLTIRS